MKLLIGQLIGFVLQHQNRVFTADGSLSNRPVNAKISFRRPAHIRIFSFLGGPHHIRNPWVICLVQIVGKLHIFIPCFFRQHKAAFLHAAQYALIRFVIRSILRQKDEKEQTEHNVTAPADSPDLSSVFSSRPEIVLSSLQSAEKQNCDQCDNRYFVQTEIINPDN